RRGGAVGAGGRAPPDQRDFRARRRGWKRAGLRGVQKECGGAQGNGGQSLQVGGGGGGKQQEGGRGRGGRRGRGRRRREAGCGGGRRSRGGPIRSRGTSMPRRSSRPFPRKRSRHRLGAETRRRSRSSCREKRCWTSARAGASTSSCRRTASGRPARSTAST